MTTSAPTAPDRQPDNPPHNQQDSLEHISDQLLEDLLNPAMPELAICKIHNRTLAQLAAITASPTFQQAIEHIAQIRTARAEPTRAAMHTQAAAALAALIHPDPRINLNPETARKAANALLRETCPPGSKPTKHPKPRRGATNHKPKAEPASSNLILKSASLPIEEPVMKSYTCSVDIQLPRDIVVDLFHDPDNLPKWQDGFVSWEHLEGEYGEVGFKAKLHYTMGKNSIELIETITNINPPEVFDGTYEWKGGKNTLINRFTELSPDATRWESTCEYEFYTLGLKLMGLVVPFVFRQQNQKFLDNFKAFAELGADVRNPNALPNAVPDASAQPPEPPPP